jgi:hypothetical protein
MARAAPRCFRAARRSRCRAPPPWNWAPPWLPTSGSSRFSPRPAGPTRPGILLHEPEPERSLAAATVARPRPTLPPPALPGRWSTLGPRIMIHSPVGTPAPRLRRRPPAHPRPVLGLAFALLLALPVVVRAQAGAAVLAYGSDSLLLAAVYAAVVDGTPRLEAARAASRAAAERIGPARRPPRP